MLTYLVDDDHARSHCQLLGGSAAATGLRQIEPDGADMARWEIGGRLDEPIPRELTRQTRDIAAYCSHYLMPAVPRLDELAKLAIMQRHANSSPSGLFGAFMP